MSNQANIVAFEARKQCLLKHEVSVWSISEPNNDVFVRRASDKNSIINTTYKKYLSSNHIAV